MEVGEVMVAVVVTIPMAGRDVRLIFFFFSVVVAQSPFGFAVHRSLCAVYCREALSRRAAEEACSLFCSLYEGENHIWNSSS